MAGDVAARQALAPELPDTPMRLAAPLPARGRQVARALGRGRRVRPHDAALGRGGGAPGPIGLAQLAGLGGEGQLQRLGQVPQQVEAVRDLHGGRRAPADALGVGPGAVAGDHGDAGMLAQPGRERVRSASRSGSSATGRRRSRSTSTVP
jgi:hypothetical protein